MAVAGSTLVHVTGANRVASSSRRTHQICQLRLIVDFKIVLMTWFVFYGGVLLFIYAAALGIGVIGLRGDIF